MVATLPVPVWCVGSSNRDEAWSDWEATVMTVATAGKRQLHVVRMKGVCDGTDKDLVMVRVIATPGERTRAALLALQGIRRRRTNHGLGARLAPPGRRHPA